MFCRTLALLLLSFPLCALEFGNPYLPQIPAKGVWTPENAWVGIKGGYVGEWIEDLKLEVKRPKSGFSHSVKEYETWSHLAQLALNLGQRFQLYGQMGVMKAQSFQKPMGGIRVEMETKSQFAGGLGARLVLMEWSCAAIGVNANGLVSCMDVDHIEQNDQRLLPGHALMQYRNWQIGGNIGTLLGPFIPYMGLAYQSATIKYKNLPRMTAFGFEPNPRKLKSRIHTILFFGTGMTLDRGFDLNFEVRMIGEIGGSLGIDLRF